MKMSKKQIAAKLGIAMLIAMACNLTSFAYEKPNNTSEAEPNNTKRTAQLTTQNNETVEKTAIDDWSGRYSVYGEATSSDHDWYKIVLTQGEHYLSVVHSYGDNATYVELLDSKNNIIIPKKYGTGYNVSKFNSDGGTYYIHIVGASPEKNQYTLFVGTPMFSTDELTVEFEAMTKRSTIRKKFSLTDETSLPPDSVISIVQLRSYSSKLSSACFTGAGYTDSIVVNASSCWDSGNIGSLCMDLKNDWILTIQPKQTITFTPQIKFFYVYPVYDNTVYEHNQTIKK